MAGVATLLYGILTVAVGLIGHLSSGGWVSTAVGGLAGLSLLVCARFLLKGVMAAGFVTGALAMLLGLFFGYRFIVSGNLAPGGLMLIASFVTLFFVLVGLFTTLAKRS